MTEKRASSRSVKSRSLLARSRNSWKPSPAIKPRTARRSASVPPPSSAAYSAAVGMRPAKIRAARRKVRRGASSRTPSKRPEVDGAATGSSPSRVSNRAMWTKSSASAASCTPPPWPMPWTRFKSRVAASGTSARKVLSASMLRDWWSAEAEAGVKRSRAPAARPPATWQRTQRLCTISETCSAKMPAAEASSGIGPWERFASCPLLSSRFNTCKGTVEAMSKRQLPAPSPRPAPRPGPSPVSNCQAS